MFALTKAFGTLYAAALLMQLGSSLLMTYLALRLEAAGMAAFWGGTLMAANALGMVVGGRLGYWLIGLVSHPRAFMVCAAVIVTTVLSHQLSDELGLWLVLRFVVGAAMMCQLMVIESWLNDCALPGRRGSTLSVYMVTSYVGMMLGQLLLGLGEGLDVLALNAVAIAFALGVVPMAMHRGLQPGALALQRVAFSRYVRRLPQAMGTVLASGLLNGCFYGLAPIFAAQMGFAPPQVGQFMALGIAAGLLAQLPLGWLSDRVARATLIRATAVLLCLACLPMALLAAPSSALLMALGAAIGFLQFCLYPLGVAYANENLEPALRVSLAGVLLMTFGIGATFGPLLAGSMMERAGPQALYLFAIAVTLALALLIRPRASRSSLDGAAPPVSPG